MYFGIVTVQAWLHLLFSLLSTSMLMCAHSMAHLIIYTRNLAHASLETAVCSTKLNHSYGASYSNAYLSISIYAYIIITKERKWNVRNLPRRPRWCLEVIFHLSKSSSGQKKLPASRWGPKLLRRRLSICGRTRSASERGRRKPGHHRYHRRRAGASFKFVRTAVRGANHRWKC